MIEKTDDSVIIKITYKRDLTAEDYEYYREHFGDRLHEKGKRHVVVRFENAIDYLAFLVVTGHVKMTQLVTGVDVRDIEDSFSIPLEK